MVGVSHRPLLPSLPTLRCVRGWRGGEPSKSATEQVPVSAYVGSSKNLKDLKSVKACTHSRTGPPQGMRGDRTGPPRGRMHSGVGGGSWQSGSARDLGTREYTHSISANLSLEGAAAILCSLALAASRKTREDRVTRLFTPRKRQISPPLNFQELRLLFVLGTPCTATPTHLGTPCTATPPPGTCSTGAPRSYEAASL